MTLPDPRYMQRALELARKGFPHAMPNPMVGAVIVSADGRIIGEGYHRRCGEAHAEVNAINQFDRLNGTTDLKSSTMYVTLEPCAHYGRTGPCAQLIIDRGIGRVVVGTRDPFEKVDGKGIEMMRQAGITVEVGMLEDECRSLNAIFFTAHTLHRPFIMLKWAQTANGYIDVVRNPDCPALKISTAMTALLTHRLRAAADGILVGSQTVIADNPRLDTRLWPGQSPRPIVLDRRRRVTDKYSVFSRNPIIISDDIPLSEVMHRLYEEGITSVLVEGGAKVLTSMIEAGLWDLAQVETSPIKVGAEGSVRAPYIPRVTPLKEIVVDGHNVKYYSENPLVHVKNL